MVWTYVAYMESGEDCGVWGNALQHARTRCRTSRSARAAPSSTTASSSTAPRHHHQQAHGLGLPRDQPRARSSRSIAATRSIVTGGSTSGCVRATVVDSLSRSYRTIVPEECVADKHESPHFANLYDMAVKYADVVPVAEVIQHLCQLCALERRPRQPPGASGRRARAAGEDRHDAAQQAIIVVDRFRGHQSVFPRQLLRPVLRSVILRASAK